MHRPDTSEAELWATQRPVASFSSDNRVGFSNMGRQQPRIPQFSYSAREPIGTQYHHVRHLQ